MYQVVACLPTISKRVQTLFMTKNQSSKISIRFISLGCAKNLVDSEIMHGLMLKDNFEVLPEDADTDVGVVNTCGFIEASKQESINTVLELARSKQTGKLKLLVMAGCLSQRYAEELPKLLPEVDAFIGTGDFTRLSELIHEKLAGSEQKVFVRAPTMDLPRMDLPRVHSTPSHYRYVKISEGCSHRCSFCAIPMMRGTLQSRTPNDILSEIESGVKNNVKEFNFIGQDLNEYGRDLKERSSLYELLKKTGEIKGDFWMRLLYMYPLQFPDRLVSLIKDHPHIVPYVDIPLQHINDAVLKSMNRGSSSRYIHRLIDKLKTEIPNIVLRTTFIVGYPEETDAHFGELLKFVRETEFDRLGVFTYSVEEGTPAATLTREIPDHVKQNRYDVLMRTQQEIAFRKNKAMIGKKVKVLYEELASVEDQEKNPNISGVGRYFGQAPDIDGDTFLIFKNSKKTPAIGNFVDAKIKEVSGYDLIAEVM